MNVRTPLFAFDFLRTSLMTLVSTKHMIVSGLILQPLKILILPDVGHACERFCETLPLWPQQKRFEQSAMFGLSTSTVPCRTLLECIDNSLIEVSDYEACHNSTPSALVEKWLQR